MENPAEELAWLREWVNSYENECTCGAFIYQAICDNQEVFYTAYNTFYCDGTGDIYLYNCEGDLIKTISHRDDPQPEELISPTLFYSCTPTD